MELAGGVGDEIVAVHSSIPLQPGWNLVRLDLAEVGESIPLDNVRRMRLSVSGLENPVDLHLDDILLTAYRQDVFGDSGDREGNLYVQRVGRHWRIGAGGQFELAFANGQIVAWYNLAADPNEVDPFSLSFCLDHQSPDAQGKILVRASCTCRDVREGNSEKCASIDQSVVQFCNNPLDFPIIVGEPDGRIIRRVQ